MKKEIFKCPEHNKEQIATYHKDSKHHSLFKCGCICNKDGGREKQEGTER